MHFLLTILTFAILAILKLCFTTSHVDILPVKLLFLFRGRPKVQRSLLLIDRVSSPSCIHAAAPY